MPLAFDPDAVGRFYLKCDVDKPEPRPAFKVRFLTARASGVLQERRKALAAEAPKLTAEEFWRRWFEILSIGVTGWENMPLEQAELPPDAPVSVANLKAILTDEEMGELFWNFENAVLLNASDRKNLQSPQSPASPEAMPVAEETEPLAAA